MANLRNLILGRQQEWVPLVFALVGLGMYLHW